MSREKLVRTVMNKPWRGGLMTAGKRAIVPETALWKSTNYTFDMDGTIQKRPGISTWNKFAIRQITALGAGQLLSFHEVFDNLDSWAKFETIGTAFHVAATNNGMEFSIPTWTAPTLTSQYWDVPPVSALTSSAHSARFMYQVQNIGAAPASGASDSLAFISSGDAASSSVHIGVFSGGLYYHDTGTTWVLIAGSASMASSAVHEIEIRCEGTGGDCAIYGDGVLLETIAVSLMWNVSPKGDLFEFAFGQRIGGVAYSGRVWDLMWKNDATDPFAIVPLKAVTDFSIITETGASRKFVVAATESSVHTDTNFSQVFTPLIPLQHTQTHFAKFRDRLIIINHDNGSASNMYSWDGKGDAEVQTDAPKVRFAVEHKTRLWAAGNVKHPLRVYFSASRKENTWFDPDVDPDETRDSTLNAGYLEIPPRGGSEITALFGDYYGNLIVFTDRGVWRVAGSDINSFAVDSSLSRTEGAVGPLAVTPVGNDLWFLGNAGVYSLAGTEKFGDMVTQTVSAPILNLWSATRTSQTSINTNALRGSIVTYLDRTAQVLLALPSASSLTLDNIYVFSLASNEWIGPWEVDATGLTNIELGYPLRSNTVTCLTTGQLGYVNPMRHADFDGDYATELQTAMLDGRSLGDPLLIGVARRMRHLRLYFQARGNWDFTVKLYADGRFVREETRKQGKAVNFPYVDGTFQADSPSKGFVVDEETIIPVEFNLDFTSNNFSFTVTTPAEEQHIVLQGYEVDLIPAGNVQGVY